MDAPDYCFPAVLPADLILHPTFPAQPALQPDTLDLDAAFRHSGWLRDRRRVWDALNVVFPGSTRTERFRSCGTNAWVIRSEDAPDSFAVASDHCHDRFCRPCSAFRGRVIANKISAYLENRQYRFLTLTIKTTGLDLVEGVKKLSRCFGALRRSKLWQSKVVGGCSVIEVKPKDNGPGWHPHIHAIIEGRYLPLKPIRKLWMNITGDSFIVDISIGRDPVKAGRYVSKYVTKPFDDGTTRTPTRLREAIRALHGRRLVATFGAWRGLKLTVYVPSGVWIRVCTLDQLRAAASEGEDDAVSLYRYLYENRAYRNVPRPLTRASPNRGERRNAIDATTQGRRSNRSGKWFERPHQLERLYGANLRTCADDDPPHSPDPVQPRPHDLPEAYVQNRFPSGVPTTSCYYEEPF